MKTRNTAFLSECVGCLTEFPGNASTNTCLHFNTSGEKKLLVYFGIENRLKQPEVDDLEDWPIFKAEKIMQVPKTIYFWLRKKRCKVYMRIEA